MEKEFLPYQESLELKELGFNEKCAAHYLDEDDLELKWKIYRNLSFNTDNCVQAPLYQQAFRWFREKYDLHVSFGRLYDTAETKKYVIDTYNEICSYEVDYSGGHSTYEEAELACLKKLIEIVKNNNHE